MRREHIGNQAIEVSDSVLLVDLAREFDDPHFAIVEVEHRLKEIRRGRVAGEKAYSVAMVALEELVVGGDGDVLGDQEWQPEG